MKYQFRNKTSVKKTLKKNDLENPPIGSSERGSILPVLFGTRKVAPVFAWCGNRVIKKQESGGKGTGGGGSTIKTYYESGMHAICVGPVYALTKIFENGDLIYEPEEPITCENTPSGTTIYPYATYKKVSKKINRVRVFTQEVRKLNKKLGEFKIYWGDSFVPGYPYNETLSKFSENLVGRKITSHWPRLCYIFWENKKLGNSPNWPSIEYEVSSLFPAEAYDAGTIYSRGMTCTSGGKMYYYINASSAAGVSVSNTSYWHEMEQNQELANSSFRIDGDLITASPYSSATIYNKWDLATSEGKTYVYIYDYPLANTPLDDVRYWVEYTPPTGMNPASIIKQTLTAPFPYGMGFSTDYINNTALENVGVKAEEEMLALNYLANDGVMVSDMLETIAKDTSMYFTYKDEKIVPYLLRADNAISYLTDDVVLNPTPSSQIPTAAGETTLNCFMYPNRYDNYKDADFCFSIDDQRNSFGNYRPNTEKIETAIDNEVAYVIAQRRELELTHVSMAYEFSGVRECLQLRPGHLISVPDINDTLRISSVGIEGSSATIQAFYDYYDLVPNKSLVIGPVDPRANYTAQEDEMFRLVELPYDLNKTGETRLAVLRQRANEGVSGYNLWATPDAVNITYASIANFTDNNSVGGILFSNISSTDVAILDEPPLVQLPGPLVDLNIIPDWSGDDQNWLTGSTLVFINNEIFFLQSYSSVSYRGSYSGSTEYLFGDATIYLGNYYIAKQTCTGILPTNTEYWRLVSDTVLGDCILLNGMVRARYDTINGSHVPGDEVYITRRDSLQSVPHNMFKEGIKVTAFTQPFTLTDIIEAEEATYSELDLVDRINRPLPCDNFRANESDTYVPGGFIEFTWTYRAKEGQGVTPSEVLAGQQVIATQAPHEGVFVLRFYDLGELRRTEIIDSDTGYYKYSNADMITDFGGEPDSGFTVTLVNRIGRLESEERVISITRDESAATTVTTPPTPNPAAWFTYPTPTTGSETTSLTMVAVTATAFGIGNSVEYYFECVEGPDGADSGWQSSATYVNSGLRPNTVYTYRIRVRDSYGNLTDWSDEHSSYTDAEEVTGINWKGLYAAGTQYYVQDAVYFIVSGKSQSYICHTQPPAAGYPPTNSTYWDLMSQAGAEGANGRGYYSIYRRSATALDSEDRPSTNIFVINILGALDGAGEGWYTYIPDGTDDIWQCNLSKQIPLVATGIAKTEWTIPKKISGEAGADGETGPAGTVGAAFPVPKNFNWTTSGSYLSWSAGSIDFGSKTFYVNGSSTTIAKPTSGAVWIIANCASAVNGTTYTITNSSSDKVFYTTSKSVAEANAGNGKWIIAMYVEQGASMVWDTGVFSSFVNTYMVRSTKVITDSAQIEDAVITNAKIGNLAVNTIKIADQAISDNYGIETYDSQYATPQLYNGTPSGFGAGLMGIRLPASEASVSRFVFGSGVVSATNEDTSVDRTLCLFASRIKGCDVVKYNSGIGYRAYACIKTHTSSSVLTPVSSYINNGFWCEVEAPYAYTTALPAWSSSHGTYNGPTNEESVFYRADHTIRQDYYYSSIPFSFKDSFYDTSGVDSFYVIKATCHSVGLTPVAGGGDELRCASRSFNMITLKK